MAGGVEALLARTYPAVRKAYKKRFGKDLPARSVGLDTLIVRHHRLPPEVIATRMPVRMDRPAPVARDTLGDARERLQAMILHSQKGRKIRPPTAEKTASAGGKAEPFL